jgi:hypothetical protein
VDTIFRTGYAFLQNAHKLSCPVKCWCNHHKYHAHTRQPPFNISAPVPGNSPEYRIRFKIAVFWVVAPCSLVEGYQRFRGPCCLHHQGRLHGATTQKTAIFILTAVRTSNPTYYEHDNGPSGSMKRGVYIDQHSLKHFVSLS